MWGKKVRFSNWIWKAPYGHFSNMFWKAPYKLDGIWKIENICCCTGLVLNVEKSALYKMDLKNALKIKHTLCKLSLKNGKQSLFKYDLESALQTEWHLENWKQMLCTVLVWTVEKKKPVLFKMVLKSALQAVFKYDLETYKQNGIWKIEK